MDDKKEKSKKILHDAYMIKAIEDLAELPSDEELEKRHEFSPEFEQAMEDMMDKYFPQKPDND